VSTKNVFLLLRFSKKFQTYAKTMANDFELQDKIRQMYSFIQGLLATISGRSC
jgi:hypothetical protein